MIKNITDKSFKDEVLIDGIFLVDFYANWCGPCMMLSPILEEISNSRSNYNILKVDVDNNMDIVNKLKIDTIPTLCLYKNGKLMERQIGMKSKDELIEMLEKYDD